jgi:hypothetical protein
MKELMVLFKKFIKDFFETIRDGHGAVTRRSPDGHGTV